MITKVFPVFIVTKPLPTQKDEMGCRWGEQGEEGEEGVAETKLSCQFRVNGSSKNRLLNVYIQEPKNNSDVYHFDTYQLNSKSC